jgi:hypothetical protein
VGITVGEVEAVFVARDQMTDVASKCSSSVVDLTGKLSLAKAEAKNAQTELRMLTAAMADMSDKAKGSLQGELTQTSQKLLDAQSRVSGLRDQLTSLNPAVDGNAKSMDAYGIQLVTAKESTEALGESSGRAASSIGLMAALAVGYKVAGVITDTAEWGHEIENLSLQTGIETDKLQTLNIVSQQYGVEANTMARSISMLSRRIAGDDDSARNAIASLGLSFEDLKGASPYDVFIQIGEAIGHVSDQQQKALLANELFGRGGVQMLAAFNSKFDETIAKVKDLNMQLDSQSVAAIADFDKAMQRGAVNAKIVTGEIIAAWSYAWDQSKDFIAKVMGQKGPDDNPEADRDRLAAVESNARAALDRMRMAGSSASSAAGSAMMSTSQLYEQFIEGLETSVKPLTDEQQAMMQRLANINELTEKNAKQIGVTSEQYREYTAQLKETNEAYKEQAARVKELDAEQMASYAKRSTELAKGVTTNDKNYGPEEQIARLGELAQAEQRLAQSVYNTITSERDRLKIVEDSGKRQLDILTQINAKEMERAKLTNAAILENLGAKERNNAAYGLDVHGNPQRPADDPYKQYQSDTNNINRLKGQAPGANLSDMEAERDRKFGEAMLKAAEAGDKLTQANTTAATAGTQLAQASVGTADAFAKFTGLMVPTKKAPTDLLDDSIDPLAVSGNVGMMGPNSNWRPGMGGQPNIGMPGPLITARGTAAGLSNTIPRFADGGVVDSPTLAWVGDGGEREHIIPESKMARTSGSGGAGGDVHVHEGAVQIVNPIMTDPRGLLMVRQAVGKAMFDGAQQNRQFGS